MGRPAFRATQTTGVNMIQIKKTTGPTLVGGAFDLAFGEMEKVEDVAVHLEGPAADNTDFAVKTSVAATVVTITITKVTTTAVSPTAWGNATTGDVAGLDVVAIAKGI